MKTFAAVLFAVVAPVSTSFAARAEALKDQTPNIVVTGEASIEAAPDRATLYFAVETERPTAVEAAAENARTAQALGQELAAQGIGGKDIATLDVSLVPVSREERDSKGAKTTKNAFRARNAMSARVTPVDRAGVVAAKLMEKGANSFQGMEFDIADPAAKRDELRKAAVEDAQKQAKAYVEAAGAKLGRILEMRPESDDEERPMARPMARAGGLVAAAAPAVPVAGGVKRLAARVTITYAIGR